MARNRKRITPQPTVKIPVVQNAIDTVPAPETPNISYNRSEYVVMLDKWRKIADCLQGQDAIKCKGEVYLPMPRVEDDPDAQANRYKTYKERAVYYNVPSRTLNGFMGQVFSRDPIRKLPPLMEAIADDIDGEGVSLDQLAKKTLGYTMGFGRAGLLADYPPVDGPITVAEQTLRLIRPTVSLVHPLNIINWRTQLIGGRKMLTLVVIMEQAIDADDGFECSYVQQWRVLMLKPDGYYVQLWRREAEEDSFLLFREYQPKDGQGNPFMEIPFQFVGPYDNNDLPDVPPLLDLCDISIAHYRNSADYEEMAWIAGQPTAFFSGLTEQWVKDVFKDGQVYLGSRAIVPLPQGATAGLLQVAANSVPHEAMLHKENQMVAMGANLLTQKSGNRTFGEAQMETSNEQSVLSAATKNVSAAMERVLRWAWQFEGGPADDESVEYDLNTDFPATRLTPNERAELILEWQQGAITFSEMRNGLRRAGVATDDDAAAQTEGKQTVEFLAGLGAKTGSAASGGTNTPKLNQGNGGGNQAGN